MRACMMRRIVTVIAAGAGLLSAGGCIIVVDHDDGCCEWESEARVPRRALGVDLESVGSATASQLGLDRERVALVTRVYGESPAERAGLRRYDIITRIDGDDGASPRAVRERLRARKGGDDVHLTVLREGKPVELVATLRN